MIEDPAARRVEADLASLAFAAGVEAGRWRIVASAFPTLDIMIAATEPDGRASEYGVRFELSNFPATAPRSRIWNFAADTPLATPERPQGNRRVQVAFQSWGDDTVYRPWERNTGPHNSIAANSPLFAWRPDRTLAFILEDLHGILNLNARARRLRAAA
jgi:hypothetical protein